MATQEGEFTPAQDDAIKKAYSILGEHFDNALIAVSWEPEDSENDAFSLFYKGGWMAAIGLASMAKKQLEEKT